MINIIKHIPFSLREFYKINRAEDWSRERLEQYQLRMINQILAIAKDIPFYRDLYEEAGIRNFQLNNLNDFSQYPTVNKAICRDKGYEGYLGNATESTTLITSTSGSTGTPFKIRIPRKIEFLPPLKVIHAMKQFGWHPLMKGLEIWREDNSTHKLFMKKIGLLESISIFKPIKDIADRIIKFKPDYIFCTRSFFLIVADYMEENNLSYTPKFLLCTTEQVSEEHRHRLESFFKAPLINVYGCMECPTLGYTCPHFNRMHIFGTTVYFEVVNRKFDNGKEIGEVVITNLNNDVMPFIRYKTGDVVEIEKEACACKRKGLIIGSIQGRNDNIIRLKNGKYLNFHHFYHAFRDVGFLLQYQIVHNTKNDNIEFKFHLKEDENQANRHYMYELVHSLFSDLNYQITFSSAFEIAESGKTKLIIVREG